MASLTVSLSCYTIRPRSPQQGLTMDYNARCWLSLSYFMPLLVWSHIVPYMAASFLCRSCPLLIQQDYQVIKLQVGWNAEARHWNNAVVPLLLLRAWRVTRHTTISGVRSARGGSRHGVTPYNSPVLLACAYVPSCCFLSNGWLVVGGWWCASWARLHDSKNKLACKYTEATNMLACFCARCTS